MGSLKTAAQQALEALDLALPIIQHDALMMAAISRHAPLDQESQAKHDSTEYASERLERTVPDVIAALRAALATAPEAPPSPPQRKPLTDEQLYALTLELGLYSAGAIWAAKDMARAVERAHGIGVSDE